MCSERFKIDSNLSLLYIWASFETQCIVNPICQSDPCMWCCASVCCMLVCDILWHSRASGHRHHYSWGYQWAVSLLFCSLLLPWRRVHLCHSGLRCVIEMWVDLEWRSCSVLCLWCTVLHTVDCAFPGFDGPVIAAVGRAVNRSFSLITVLVFRCQGYYTLLSGLCDLISNYIVV